MSVNVLYTTQATAIGGRDGRATTQDGSLDVKLTTPKELGGPDNALKGAAHRVSRSEATCIRYLFQPHRGTVNHPLCSLHAKTINKLPWVHLHLAQTHAREVARTHADPLSQCFDRKIRFEVFKHVDLQLAQRFRGSCLSRGYVAVLSLTARTNEEHDELARHRERCLVPVILFDES
jgi:hypothetical protein